MESVTLEKKERKPLGINPVMRVKLKQAESESIAVAPKPKVSRELSERPNYLLRLL